MISLVPVPAQTSTLLQVTLEVLLKFHTNTIKDKSCPNSTTNIHNSSGYARGTAQIQHVNAINGKSRLNSITNIHNSSANDINDKSCPNSTMMWWFINCNWQTIMAMEGSSSQKSLIPTQEHRTVPFLPFKFKYLLPVLQQLDRQQHKRTTSSIGGCCLSQWSSGHWLDQWPLTSVMISADDVWGPTRPDQSGLHDQCNDGHSFSREIDSHQSVEWMRVGEMKVEVKLSL